MLNLIKNFIVRQVFAADEIINEAIAPAIGSKTPSAGIAFYIGLLWRTIVTVGGIAFIIYFVLGGIEWLTAGGDKAKVEYAQKIMSNAFIGLTILVGSYAIIFFAQGVLKINILAPVFPNNL